MTFCLEEHPNNAELICGILGVIAYLCEKLFMCPERITEIFSLGDFICDSSNVVRYTEETVNKNKNKHGAAGKLRINSKMMEMEPLWERIYSAVNVLNMTDAMNTVPMEARDWKECGPKSELKMKRTHFICGLLGSFGFICDGLNCPEIATESFKAGDFACDLSSVLKYIGLTVVHKDGHKSEKYPVIQHAKSAEPVPGIRRQFHENDLHPNSYPLLNTY